MKRKIDTCPLNYGCKSKFTYRTVDCDDLAPIDTICAILYTNWHRALVQYFLTN